MIKSRWRWLFAAFLVVASVGLRAPWFSHEIWNLDEGSTFTMAEQVRHGAVLYRDAADNRSPLVPYLKAAVFAICGDWNAWAVHVAVAVMLGIVAVLLWQTARSLADEMAGVAAALFFLVLSLVMLDVPDTLSAHTGWFLVFFSSVGFLLFVHGVVRHRPSLGAAAGVGFALATLSKQPGVLDFGASVAILGLLGMAEPGRHRESRRMLLAELLGFSATILVALAYFASRDALGDLLTYAWTFNTKIYVSEVPIRGRVWAGRIPFKLLLSNMPLALGASAAGIALMVVAIRRSLKARPSKVPLLACLGLGWTSSGLFSTILSGREFSHYSAQIIPGICLAGGWAVARLVELFARMRHGRSWPTFVELAALGLVTTVAIHDVVRREHQFTTNDDDTKNVGKLVRQFTDPKDRIFIWGYVPELYFFSRRLPSTRFIYTNYLTGMIPWSNLDMLIDTSYAIMPGAWRDCWIDFSRKPPALIVDTLATRGYIKYPLYAQKVLWRILTNGYAEVAHEMVMPKGFNLYRKLSPLDNLPPVGRAIYGDNISIHTSMTRHGGQIPVLTVTGPPDSKEIIVYQGNKPYRHLHYAETLPCEASFFVKRRDLKGSDTRFHVAILESSGWKLSRTVDLAEYRLPPPKPVFTGPTIRFGDRELLPVDAETIDDPGGILYDNGQRWSAHAPSRFVYECPPSMTRLNFSYGLDEDSYKRTPELSTKGAEVVISLLSAGGKTTRLFRRELNPRAVGRDQGTQSDQIEIPRHDKAQLILQVLPGPMNDPSFCWAYWSNLVALGLGPDLAFEGRLIQATSSERYGGGPMQPIANNRWSADSPSKVIYPYATGMSSLTFTYGLLESAYDPARGAGTDGVEVMVDFERPDHSTSRLFDRELDPHNNVNDRGPQSSVVALPRSSAGNIVIQVGPGPHNNTAFDWAYLADLKAHGPRIGIRWNDRLLYPIESQTFTGPTETLDDNGRWRAHAPSRLVFARPPEMEALAFGFGLDPRTYLNPNPEARTAGVDVLVQFENADGRAVTLFTRTLDPAHQPADRGAQEGQVHLPPKAAGKLILIFTPGERSSNAFDWSYWTKLVGSP